ncbi:MAG: GyrI-like domain-containing protein [Jatrophihabitans sp.]
MVGHAQPQIVERAEQPYVAIRGRVTMTTIPAIADRFPELMSWLADRDIPVTAAPFLKYNVFDASGVLEIEAAAPVASLPVTATSDAVVSGTVPAGRYASLIHLGPFEGLQPATERLLTWASDQELAWDASDGPVGERWGGRLEIYHTDPRQAPQQDWKTELAFRLAD